MQEQFSELSRKYREEMLRMYGKKSAPTQEPTPMEQEPMQEEMLPDAQEQEVPEMKEEAFAEPVENPDFTGRDGDYQDMIESEFPREYEEPEIPDYIKNGTAPEISQEAADSMQDLTGTGQLRVATLSGDGAFPVEGSTVTVAVRRNGREQLAYLLVTDESGETPTVSLPAPPASLSQQPGDVQPFTVVDIRVLANGYFRAEMRNVPIFAGVTSLQTFQLIPLPVLMHEDQETLSGSSESPDL